MARYDLFTQIRLALGLLLISILLIPSEVLFFRVNPTFLGFLNVNIASIIISVMFAGSIVVSIAFAWIGFYVLIPSLGKYLKFVQVSVNRSNKNTDVEGKAHDLNLKIKNSNVGYAQARHLLWAVFLKSKTRFVGVNPRKLAKCILIAKQSCPDINHIYVFVASNADVDVEQLWIEYKYQGEVINEKIAVALG